MTATRTLSEMRSRARQLADMVGSTFVTDTELDGIINEHCQGLYDLLIEVRGQGYYAAKYPVTTTTDQEEYALPSDFYQMAGAPILYDGSDYYQMRTWEENERSRLLNLNTGQHPNDIRYRMVAGKLALLPAPRNSTWIVQLRYIPTMERLVDDSDTFDGINGWERHVELSSAIEALIKEESDPSGRVAELAKVEARIRKLAPSRDAAMPPRIVDTRRDWGWSEGYYNYDWDA